MARPKLKELAYMLGIYSNKTIPQTYIGEFSNYELLLSLLSKVNEIIEQCNSYKEILDEIQKVLDDMDDAIREEVEKILNEMYEDGTLSDVIAEVLSTEIPTRTGNLDLSCMGWHLTKAHSFGNYTELPTAEQIENFTVDEEFYNFPQGCCTFEINGNLFWAIACICQNGSHFDYNNGARIYVYTVNQDGSLSYVTDKEYANLGHCNGMAFYNGALYITPNSYEVYNVDTQQYEGRRTTDIHRISFDGSALGDSVYTVTLTPLEYNPTVNFYDNVCTDGTYLYAFNENFSCCKIKFVADNPLGFPTGEVELTEWTEINGVGIGRSGTTDGLCMTDDYIYFSARIYRIKRYNKHTKKVDWTYQLPVKPNNKQYKLGEVEGFTIIDNVLYLLGAYNLGSISTKANCYTIMRFFRQNIVTNEINPTNTLGWNNGSITRNVNLYVSGNLPSDTRNPRNIDGRSKENGFSCIQEAVDFIESNDWIGRVTLKINQYRNLSPIEIFTTKPITISGTDYMNEHSTWNAGHTSITEYSRASIGHVYVMYGSNITLGNLAINNILPSDVGNSNVIDNCVYAEGCNIRIEHLYLPTGLNSNAISVQQALRLNRVIGNLKIDMNAWLDADVTGQKDTAIYYWYNQHNRSNYFYMYDCSINTHKAWYYAIDGNGNYRNLFVNSDDLITIRNENIIG